MPPDSEARVRAAVAELADALIELARTSAPQADAGPVELLSPATFSRRAGLGRSTTYLAVANGEIRSLKLRGRRLIPASELARLARSASPIQSTKKAGHSVSSGPAKQMEATSDGHAPAA